jgi:hypothetical protein
MTFDSLNVRWWFGIGFGIISNYYNVKADIGKFHSHTVSFVFPFMIIELSRFTTPKPND